MSKKRIALFLILILIAAGCAGYVAYSVAYRNTVSDVYDEIQSSVSEALESSEASSVEESSETSSESVEEPYVSPIDFESLWAINQDIYAYILIPDTKVSYPVLQHPTEDDYYLNVTIEGCDGYGSIYSDTVSKKDFSRFNTVLYGHRMESDGTMFGALKNYRDEEFFDEHRYITIYTPESELTYEIFAAIVYNDRRLTYYYDDDDVSDRQDFIDSIYAVNDVYSIVKDDITVTADDHLLTLSTCIKEMTDNRWLVIGKLIDEKK